MIEEEIHMSVIEEMILTLKQEAIEMNKKYFNNEIDLNRVKFNISKRYTKTRGTFSTLKGITLSYLLMEFPHEWKKTLLHELIHSYTYQKYDTLDHGKDFKALSAKIYGISKGVYNITRITEASAELNIAIKNKRSCSSSVSYAVFNPKRNTWNFLRNLKADEIDCLKNILNRVVYLYTGDIKEWRYNKNFEAYITTKYCYNARYTEEILANCKDI